MYPFRIILCFLFLGWIGFAQAQSRPPLERIVSVDVVNERLDNVLKKISSSGQFTFAYNSDIVNGSAVVTLRATNTVREILNQLFRGAMAYKSRGNHIILQRVEAPEESPKSFYLDGYIIDRQTGQKINEASIYEKTTLASTVSNPYGYYRIKLSTDIQGFRLEVRRKYYFPETVVIPSRQSHSLNIRLTPAPLQANLQPMMARISMDTTRPALIVPQPTAVAVPVDSTPPSRTGPTVWDRSKSVLEETSADFADWFKTTKQSIHDANLAGDTLYREVQFSVLPFVGTNHTLSGRVINRYSLNLVAGYSLGVTQLEVGGFLNLVRGNVDGIQVAGFSNAVGEQVNGLQVAGFFNGVRRNMTGLQLAGYGNTVIGDVRGLQGAGFFNMTVGSLHESVQLAGFGNIVVQNMSGLQAAGFVNATGRQMNGVQVAGYGNISGGDLTGWQLAGFTNVAVKRLDGWQVSAFLNYADEVARGHQIALVNLAWASETSPIGLFSYVHRNGYRRLELSTDELMTGNITFKTGMRRFYNIFTGGTNFTLPGKSLWSFGYGFGTAFDLKRGWMWNIDLTGNVLSGPKQFDWNQWNTLIRLNTALEKRLGHRMALAVGPSVNWFLSDYRRAKPLTRVEVPLFGGQANSLNTFSVAWVGFQAALRFCNRR